jgi:capsular polysaccharide biosynthesis protein/tetratricopeptide (TPR) repeat protein
VKLSLSELHYNLGYVLHQQGDLVGAAAAYRRAIEQDPTFAQAHHGLAVILGEQYQDEAAVRQYQQMLQRWPNDVTVTNNLACLLVKQGKLPEAIALYDQAIEKHPDAAILHSNWGQVIEADDPVAAIAAYRRALELRPDLVAVAIRLGFALFKQNQYDAALEVFNSVLQTDPDHVQAHLGLGLVYQAGCEWRSALFHFRQACQAQQAYLDAFCEWAESIPATDALALARRSCSRFLRTLGQGSEDGSIASEVLNALADTYARLGHLFVEYGGHVQSQQAERYYQQALQLRPDHLPLYLSLGHCLEQQQRWNAAILVYHFALVQKPQATQVYQQLGQLCEQQQRWPEAIAYYRQAIGQVVAIQQDNSSTQPSVQSALPVELRPSPQTETRSAPLPSTALAESVRLPLQICSTQAYLNQVQSGRFIALSVDAQQQLVPDTTASAESSKTNTSTFTSACQIDQSNCDGLNCQPCLARLSRQFAPLHLGRGIYHLSSLPDTFSLPMFVADLPQAQVWITPYESSWKVNNAVAVFTADQHLLTDVSREYPGQMPICTQPQAPVQRFLQRSEQIPERIPGRVAALAGLSGHNYFHWMIDVLPRLELLQRSGLNWHEMDQFWINAPRAAFQQDTLKALGIPLPKILSADDHPYIQADQLIVPAFSGHLGWPEPWVLQFLRRQFLPMAAAQSYPKRIYISRAQAHHRRLLNEAAVLERLQACGFVAVNLESMSFAEQVGLFAQAQVVIAPHGGGLTNLIFCQSGTQVIEFFAPNYVRPYYWPISQHLKLQHYYALGTSFPCPPIQQLMYPSPLMEDIWLDLDMLNNVLAQVGC